MFIRFGERRRAEPASPNYASLGISDDPRTFTATPFVEKIKADLRQGRLTIDELPLLHSGDHVFVRREIYGPPWEWFGALLIRIGTHTRQDKRATAVNHNLIVIRAIRYEDARFSRKGKELPGRIMDYEIAEALGRGGFQYNRLLESYGDARRYSIAIARHRHARADQRAKIVEACTDLRGKSYGYLKVGAHGGDFALTVAWNGLGGRGDVYLLRRFCRMKRYPMCSWSSLYAFDEAGLPFQTPIASGSPDDLWDESRRRSLGIWLWPFCSRSLKSRLFGPGFADDFQALKRRRS